MKKFASVLLVGLLIAFVAVAHAAVPAHAQSAMPAIAAQSTEPPAPGLQLDPTQVIVLGIVSSALVMVLRLLYEFAAKQKFVVPDLVMIIIVYIVSFVLGYFWFPQSIPTLPVFGSDLLTNISAVLKYAGDLLTALTAYAAMAAGVYVVLIQKVKDGLGQALIPDVYKK